MVGLIDLHRVLNELPDRLERNVLRGAMKAGADVIADGARDLCRSSEVRETISTSASVKGRVVTALIQTKGDGAYKAPWLEYGTSAHEIRARTPEGLGRLARLAPLVIGGKFAGEAVLHPGARKLPFMRPALDQREGQAITVVGEEIAVRLGRIGAQFSFGEGDQ